MIPISDEQKTRLAEYSVIPEDVLSIKAASSHEGTVITCVMPESRALMAMLLLISRRNPPLVWQKYSGIVNDLITTSEDDEIAVDLVFYLSKSEWPDAKSNAV